MHSLSLAEIEFRSLISPGARNKKRLIFGVSFTVTLTHLVKSRDLLFLEAEIVDNMSQWDVLKNMRQIKNYDDMFQAIRALSVKKNSQSKNLN